MALKNWKRKKVDKWRILWTKGKNQRTQDFIILDETTPSHRKFYPNDRWQVLARKKINSQTINGHFRFYKNKSSALNFIKKYLSKY